MKKKQYVVLLAAVLAFCAGCHGRAPLPEEETQTLQEETEATRVEETEEVELPGEADLTVWLGNDCRSLDPAQALYQTEKTMLRHAYETLLIRGEDGEAEPGQAESWEISPDGLTVTFHLRDDLKWSDGSSLTAEDFVYSWNRLADPTEPSPYAADLLGGVEGFARLQEEGEGSLALEAPDAKTLVVTLTSPDLFFGEKCTVPAMSPVNREAAESGEDEWYLKPEKAVGNGAMVLSEYAAGDHITFVKNEQYWNADRVSLNSVTFLLKGSEEENLARYEAGQLDLMLGGVDWSENVIQVMPEETAGMDGENESAESTAAESPAAESPAAESPAAEIPDAESLEEEAGDVLHDQFAAPLAASGYILLNREIEPFGNADVCRALSLVLDREYLAKEIMEGSAEPAWTLIGPGYSDAEKGSSFVETSMARYSAEESLPADEETGEPEAVLHEETGEAEAVLNEETGEEDPATVAAMLLERAGYPGGQGIPEIEYLVNDSGYHLEVAEYLKSAWGQLGISVKIREVNWMYFIPYRDAGEFTAARGTWLSDVNDPLVFLSQFGSEAEGNDSRYFSALTDGILEEAGRETSRHECYDLLHQAEEQILEDGAAIPLVYYRDGWRQNPGLYGVRHCADGTWMFAGAYYR